MTTETFLDKLGTLGPVEREQVLEVLERKRVAELDAAPRGPRGPLSAAQTRLWYLARITAEPAAYNIPGFFRLRGPVGADALAHALRTMARRHEVLRSSVEGDPGELVVAGEVDVDLEVSGTSHRTAAQAHEEAAVFLRRPFDIARPALWRALWMPDDQGGHLVLSFHHLVFDGWSLKVFLDELLTLLDGGTFPEPAPQYPEVVRRAVNRQVARRQIDGLRGSPTAPAPDAAFWAVYLDGLERRVPLARSTPDPAPTTTGAVHVQPIGGAEWQEFTALARQENATPFAAGLSVLTAMVHRRTNSADVVLGTPVSGRQDHGTHDVIGTFVNTIPLRVQVPSGGTARDLLRLVSASSHRAFDHQDVPFERIVEIVNPDREAGAHPLFDILYTFQPAVAPRARGAVSAEYLDLDFGTAKFDLSLDVVDEDDGVRLLFEYDTARFSRATVVSLADSFVALVRQMTATPDRPLVELDVIGDEELRRIQEREAGPTHRAPADVLRAFLHHAEVSPDAPAVTGADGSATYGRLLDRSALVRDRIACAFPDDEVVAVLLPRSAALIETVLGVWRAGKACLVLDPGLPFGRIEAMVRSTGAPVVTERMHVVENHELVRTSRGLHVLSEMADAGSGAVGDAEQAGRGPAYVVFTSGSTGTPKGIVVSHDALGAMLAAWRSVHELDRPETLQIAASSFDVFWADVARVLGSGGHMRVVETEVAADPRRFLDSVRGARYDFAEFVPSVFRRVAASARAAGERLAIARVVVASESWTMDEGRAWLEDVLVPGARLFNSYGVAEATVDSTVFPVDAESLRVGPVPIGAPLPNVSVRVVDVRGLRVPDGVTGRLLVGGKGLSDGYLGADPRDERPDSPLPVRDESAVHDTGDLAHWEDGVLVLDGRVDDQVKIRGVRIEPVEVEAAVRRFEGIDEVVVTSTEDGRLVAWATSDVLSAEPQDWRRTLSAVLPGAMIPELVLVDELPRLPSGKTDRRALARRGVPTVRRRATQPETADERRMQAVFQDVLGTSPVGADDGFFALGGHSLTALELIGRVQAEFGVRLGVGELFDHATVRSLTEHVLAKEAPAATAITIVRPDDEHRHEPFPLTDIQQAYWLGRDTAFEFSGVSTHSYDELHAKGLDVDRFASSLNEVIRRHGMLRAVIVDHGSQRVIETVPEYRPIVLDLSRASQAEVEAGLSRVRDELSHQRLDVSVWPNYDIRVTVLPGDVQVLHFSTDALMLDAWSFVLVVRELSQIHDGLVLPPVDFGFRDYVLADRAHEASDEYAETRAYWAARIPTLPPAPDLPQVVRPDDLDEPRFTRLHARMAADTWDGLKRAGAERDLTPSGICLAAYVRVLASRVHDARFSLNLTFLNRKPFHPQVEDVAGEFTSLTLLPIDLTADPVFGEGARQIQRELFGVLDENDLSGVQVLRDYARHHGSPASAHFPVVFTSALGIPMPDASFPVRHQPEFGVTQTSQVWLDAGIWEDYRGDLRCNWDVVLEVYPEGFVESMFDDWVELLNRLAADPTAWDEREPHSAPAPLVSEPGQTVASTLLDPFLVNVERSPEAVAVLSATRTLSYRRTAELAGGVLRQLVAAGVEPGDAVAILLDGDWEQVVAAVGVAATAAYLPVSPDLPGERLRTILDLADVRVVVTARRFVHRLASDFDGVLVVVDELEARGAEQDAPAGGSDLELLRRHPSGPEDLAYVIFTSGSTGVPKGVMVEHRAAANTVLDVNERFGIGSGDRVLAVSSLSFDLSVYDVFGLLAAGGAVVLPEPGRRLDPLHQVACARTHGVSVWNTVPALFGLFAGAVSGQVDTLRTIMLSGDWIPLGLPSVAAAVAPGAVLHSLGGATEASIWSITHPVTRVDPEWTSIPYGKGMRGQDVVVLDASLRPAHDWVTGDLYIRGVGLANGYWADPERTAAAFFRHPVSGERLYRTGDLGRRRPDGTIEFLGRSDHQLKIGGYRVEAGEVERAVLRHPDVVQAVVVALGDRLSDKRLACAYVVDGGRESADLDLAGFVGEILPPYMVPLVFAAVGAVPLSANGKVDVAAVARDLGGLVTTAVPYVAPSHDDQRRHVEHWESVLGGVRVGMHDDFFQAGGDSVRAIELVTLLRRQHAADAEHAQELLTLADLYDQRTPERLLDLIRDRTTVPPADRTTESEESR